MGMIILFHQQKHKTEIAQSETVKSEDYNKTIYKTIPISTINLYQGYKWRLHTAILW